MSDKTVRQLENIQLFYLRLVLRVGPGTPKVALRAQTGVMAMKFRVWIEKAMLILHIRGLDESALAFKIWKEQRYHGWPGLAEEVTLICEHLGVPDINETNIEDIKKKEVRKMLNEACRID